MVDMFIFLTGLSIGSFLNVIIYRVPLEQNIIYPRSTCTVCNTHLKWWHNIPLVSYMLLKGKCNYCNSKISLQYPIVELLSGMIVLSIYYKLGLTWYMPFISLSFLLLLSLCFIDLKYMAVPDSINLAALIMSLISVNFLSSLTDAFITGFGLYIIGKISSIIAKKEALGEADIIVAATMGSLLGIEHFFVALFLSAILAIIPALIAKENGIPFIPFLTLATFIVFIYNNQIDKLLKVLIYG